MAPSVKSRSHHRQGFPWIATGMSKCQGPRSPPQEHTHTWKIPPMAWTSPTPCLFFFFLGSVEQRGNVGERNLPVWPEEDHPESVPEAGNTHLTRRYKLAASFELLLCFFFAFPFSLCWLFLPQHVPPINPPDFPLSDRSSTIHHTMVEPQGREPRSRATQPRRGNLQRTNYIISFAMQLSEKD